MNYDISRYKDYDAISLVCSLARPPSRQERTLEAVRGRTHARTNTHTLKDKHTHKDKRHYQWRQVHYEVGQVTPLSEGTGPQVEVTGTGSQHARARVHTHTHTHTFRYSRRGSQLAAAWLHILAHTHEILSGIKTSSMQNDGSMFGDDGTEMKFDVLREPPDGKRGR